MFSADERGKCELFRHKKKINKTDIVHEEYERLKIEKKRTIARMIVFILAVIAVVAILSIAWFVHNTRVQSTSTSISADSKRVELRTYGNAGIHDDLLKQIMGSAQTDSQESFWYELADAIKGSFETSSDNYAVNWLLSDQSNVGNYSTDQSDWENYWENPPQGAERQDKAIEPGTSGELTFYVVPKYNGTVKLNMNLNLIPYKLQENNFTEINANNDKVAKDFVDGHILFFLEKETDTGTTASTANKDKKEIQWIEDGTFNIVIENAKKDQQYGYTLYWCWPQSFGEAVLKAGDSYLNGRQILFSGFENGETIRNTIDLSMVEKPERYFYSNLTKNPLSSNPLSSDQKELEQIKNMYDKSSDALSSDAKNAFVDLSSYYNQADQYIGSHVDCVRIRLSADLAE